MMLSFLPVKEAAGAENAKLPNRHELITVKLAKGWSSHTNLLTFLRTIVSDHLVFKSPQMYPQNGSPLSVDSQLRLSSYISSFFPFPLLRSLVDGLLGVFPLLAVPGNMAGPASFECEFLHAG